MIAQSLWHDHDLAYDERDLRRAYQIWDQGPTEPSCSPGTAARRCITASRTPTRWRPCPSMPCSASRAWSSTWRSGWPCSSRPGGSSRTSRVRRPVRGGLLLRLRGLRLRLLDAAGGLQHGLPVLPAPPLAAAAEAGGVAARDTGCWPEPGLSSPRRSCPRSRPCSWALRSRWTSSGAGGGGGWWLAAPTLLAVLLLGIQWRVTGTWSPYRGVQRRSFESDYPVESRKDLWQAYRGTSFGSWSGLGVETTAGCSSQPGYFLVGRHTGLLPYFPFALFVLGLYLAGRRTARATCCSRPCGYCVLFLILRPNNYHGGAGFLGNRYFASVYPALLFLPAGSRPAAAWPSPLPRPACGPRRSSPCRLQVTPEATLQAHVRMPTFQALPLELTLLGFGRIPGYGSATGGRGPGSFPSRTSSLWSATRTASGCAAARARR